MPRRKNPNPQKSSPKLLKISNAKSRDKHTLFKKAHNLFHSAFTKYQSGVNPKQKHQVICKVQVIELNI